MSGCMHGFQKQFTSKSAVKFRLSEGEGEYSFEVKNDERLRAMRKRMVMRGQLHTLQVAYATLFEQPGRSRLYAFWVAWDI